MTTAFTLLCAAILGLAGVLAQVPPSWTWISSPAAVAPREQIRVIVDVDPGFDDAWALFLLIREHQNPASNVRIEAITVTNGNTVVDNGVRNVNRILEAMGASGIPVYRGSEIAMVIPWVEEVLYHGNDGFGDSGLPGPTVNETRPGHAVDKIVELAQRHSKQLTFLALGPLTNLALALNKMPEIHDAFARVIILGGNYLGFGSMSPAAGFNFFTDVEAARVVLERVTTPMVLVPDETLIDYATFPKEFRTNTLGRLRTRQVEMMNRAEAAHLARNNQTWAAADALAAAILLEPSIVTKTEAHFCTVELHGELTRGMMVVERREGVGRPPNAEIVTAVKKAEYKKMLVTAAGGRWYN